MNLFARRRVADLQAEALTDQSLKRALGPVNLTSLGIGAIIGAGIFVLTGHAAAQYAGPGIVFSFILSGLACAFAGLCYAEFASMIPLSGSAYTYGYATLGEFVAWIIGWNLILEYLFAASTVAVGWSGYVVSFLKDLGITIPAAFTSAPYDHVTAAGPALVEHLAIVRPRLDQHRRGAQCAGHVRSSPSSPFCSSSASRNRRISTTPSSR